MAQQEKHTPDKLDDLSSVSGTHSKGSELTPKCSPLTYIYTLSETSHTHTQ